MSSQLLKDIAAGKEFDVVEGIRELARVLVAQEAGQSKPEAAVDGGALVDVPKKKK